MVIPFTVHGEGVEEYPDKKNKDASGKPIMVQTKRVMLLDASDGPRLAQIVELSLPPEHPNLGVGNVVTIDIQEISSIFAGRPRIRGKIMPTAPVRPDTATPAKGARA